MKILQSTTSVQTLSFIPREYPSTVNYTLRNETTNEVVTANTITATASGGYLSVSEVFDLDEDTYYLLEVFNTSSELIYRDKIFCTNQTDYSIHDGQYQTDDTYDNEYIAFDG